jgi:uncharacterized protein
MSDDENIEADGAGRILVSAEPNLPKRRVTEILAMVAVVLAAAAVGVAVWNPAQAKAAPAKVASGPKKAVTLSDTIGCAPTSAKLTVQGTGSATATPDLLTLVVEIDATEPNAEQALAVDNSQAASVEQALAFSGVSPKDLQTTNLSIQPNYSWQNNTAVLTGYAVSNTVSVNFHFPFSKAGSAIDAITRIAGNDVRIDSLSFSFQNPATAEDQARTNAVTQAVAHAESMALAAHDRLGSVCSITDNSTVPPPSPVQYAFGAARLSAAEASTPLQPGSEQETDQVTVVYALDPGAGSSGGSGGSAGSGGSGGSGT